MSELSQLKITHQSGQYEILVGKGLLSEVADHLIAIEVNGPIGIISNNKINNLYGDPLRRSLQSAGYVTRTILIPDGEEYKTLASAEQVISALIAQGMERSGTIITLGGGVTTDLGGFVASVLYRGVGLVHIPTTLLAMVDAAVGGKTGVNHSAGKNLVGSFYQPDLVLMDVEVLSSLDQRDRVSGFAEMLKMGLIRDRDYLDFLITNMDVLLGSKANEKIIQAIVRSCELKAEVVIADEKESDLRRILNFGHTLGHAIETTLGYGKIRHGEAVILGMYGAGWLSNQVGQFSAEEWKKLSELLVHIPIQVAFDELDPIAVEQTTRLDKKVDKTQLNFVLLKSLGEAHMQTGIPKLMIKLAIESITKAWREIG
ncbi:3-dehydroquinate synthase [bacterium]|nr:3-dehydroquinate synthase [bacterium]